LEKPNVSFSNAWKKPPFRFPMLGKLFVCGIKLAMSARLAEAISARLS